jgi:mRNA interferase MazF
MNTFEKWNKLKQKLHYSVKKNFYVKKREIWYINIWTNIWHESIWKWNDYRRPVLVIKKIWNMYLVIPMTSKWTENKFKYKLPETYFSNNSFLTMSQWKFIDHKRFIKKISIINKVDFEKIKKRLITDWF